MGTTWAFESCFTSNPQVKFMKRMAETSNLTQVIRTLPRIKKHLFNPEHMRSVSLRKHMYVSVEWLYDGLL